MADRKGSTRYEVRFDATGLDFPGIEVLVVSEPNSWSLDAGNRLARQGGEFVGTAWLDSGDLFCVAVTGLSKAEAERVVAMRRLAGKTVPAERPPYDANRCVLFLAIPDDHRYPVVYDRGYPTNCIGSAAQAVA